jgi:hypothetical protein
MPPDVCRAGSRDRDGILPPVACSLMSTEPKKLPKPRTWWHAVAKPLMLIAKSSKEQNGYEQTSDTAGARLYRAQRAPGNRLSRHAQN